MNDNRIPLLNPLLAVLRSRRVVIALVSIAVALLVAAVPQLAPVQDALIVLVGSLALALITGLSWQQAAEASRERAAAPVGTPEEEVRAVVRAVLDELGLIQRD